MRNGSVLRVRRRCIFSPPPIAATVTGEYSWPVWFGVALAIQIVVGIVAFLLKQIAVVFGFSGSTIGVCFVYFLPGLFFVRLARKMSPQSRAINDELVVADAPSRRVLLVTGWFLMCAAVVLGALGTVGSTLTAISNASANSTSVAGINGTSC